MAIAGEGRNGARRRGPDLGSNTIQKIALSSEYASPLGVIGGVDAGGLNIYVANVAKQLAERDLDVDVYTRCDTVRRSAPAPVRSRCRAPALRLARDDAARKRARAYRAAFHPSAGRESHAGRSRA